MTAVQWVVAAHLTVWAAMAVLAWRHWRANAPDDLTAGIDATAEPERDHAARATPLPDADTGWLLARRTMLDQAVRRHAQETAGLLDEHDRISAELCLRGQVADGAADLEHYLSEEAEQ